MGDQSSLDKDVVEENVHNNVVPCVDLPAYLPAATDDVLPIKRLPCFAAPTLRFSPFLCYELFSLTDTEEVFLNLPYDFQRLRGAVQSPPHFLQESHVNGILVCDESFQKRRLFRFRELHKEVGIHKHSNFFEHVLDAFHSFDS